MVRCPSPARPCGIAQADLEPAKWIALLTMAVDHYGKIVDPALYIQTHLIGRVSFPLFAAIVGLRLAMSPRLVASYLRRLAPWALVSQPVFVLAGREWHHGNILMTLALGVVATWALGRGRQAHPAAALLLLAALAPLTWFVEFGPLGVAMVPLTAALASAGPRRALWASGPLGLLANASLRWPYLSAEALTALLASPLAAALVRLGVRLPRLPTHLFYAFFPGHLLILHYWDLYG
jgi:hypothetical protein